NDFSRNVSVSTKPVKLSTDNTLTVEPRGSPSSGFNLTITGEDGALPVVTVTSPRDGATVSLASLSIQGIARDVTSGINSVTCNGVAASLTGEQFTCTVILTAGPNAIVVVAKDRATNIGTTQINVTYSTTPMVTITAPSNLNFVNTS